MRPIRVVGGDVLLEHALEVPLVEHERVVEALLAQRADDPLGERVGLKRQLPLVLTVRDGFASRTPSTRCAASASSC